MNWMAFVRELKLVSPKKKFELYPPFLFMGVKILHISKDRRQIRVKLPFRWYQSNPNGSFFGGAIASVADPFPALLCQAQFPGTIAWTKALEVKFVRPGKTDLFFEIEVLPEHLETLKSQLAASRKATLDFHFAIYDKNNEPVAKIKNSVYLRVK